MTTKLLAGIASIAVIALIIGAVMVLHGQSAENENLGTSNASPTSSPEASASPSTTDAQLQVTDIAVGTGAEAAAGKTVSVNYRGTLTNGTEFDSSYKRNQPFEFVLGAGRVIQGWDQGLVGMKVGGKRKLVIPPSLGYGGQGNGTIPPNSTLIFEVELLDVK